MPDERTRIFSPKIYVKHNNDLTNEYDTPTRENATKHNNSASTLIPPARPQWVKKYANPLYQLIISESGSPVPSCKRAPRWHFLNIFQNILSLETKGIVMQKERPTGNCGGRRKINDMTSLQYVLLLFLQIDVWPQLLLLMQSRAYRERNYVCT